MRIVFWQNCLSPHQLPYISHIQDDDRVDEVVVVTGETISEERKKMGWEIGNFSGLDQCKVYIMPQDAIIETLLSQKPDDSYHLFSGIRADAFVFKCLRMSMKYNLHRGMITERPNTYNFKWNIRNGKPYWMHRLRFMIHDKKYAKNMEHVFAMGSEAVEYFKSLGIGWKVHPFCYCTQTVSGSSDIILSSVPNYVFVGSLSSRKNPLELLRAFSFFKQGMLKFIGDGVLKNKLIKEIEKNNLQEHIELVGTVSQHQISHFLYNSDVLVLPSQHDGWGAVVNEALQAGCFVVCSDVCGASMLLEKDSKLGLVFKIDSKTALVDCMDYINTHLNEIRMNRNYRMKWAEEHISGRVVAKYFIECLETV